MITTKSEDLRAQEGPFCVDASVRASAIGDRTLVYIFT